LRLLGCTARRAGLGIHRSQAGRRGSSHGRGRRVEARRTTSTPAIDSVTSATASGRPAAGRCRLCAGPVPARARNHRHRPRPPQRARARCITVTVTGPPQRPGSGAPPGTTKPGRGTRLRHRTRPPLRAGAGAARAVGRAGPRGPLRFRTLRSAGRHSGTSVGPDAGLLATAGPDAMCTVVRGGGSAGPVSPRSVRRGHRYCAACAACPSLDSGTHGGPCRRAGSPPLGRRYAPGCKRRGLRRDRYRLGVIAEPTVSVTGARAPAVHSSLPSGQRRPGREPGRFRPMFAGHYPSVRASSRFSRAAGGVLTGPRPAPAAGLGRAGRARGTRTTLQPEPRAGRRGRPGPDCSRAGHARCKGPTLT
jgi:hypothetical protein